MAVSFSLDGNAVVVADEGISLLIALRDVLGVRSPKDGCSPQGQCGCCTVLVDGAPRVACVTAVRRVAGRRVVTADGLDPGVALPLVAAFEAHGASQCGFCTPGLLCRLAALGPAPERGRVESALLAHLCRCTGWQPIVDAALGAVPTGPDGPRPGAAARAALEGGSPQTVGAPAVLGRGGFADDTAPPGALVAVPDGAGGWAVGASVVEARSAAGKVQGRRSGAPLTWPLAVPDGDWVLVLQTTWVEPGYLEPDASWCEPGGEPVSPAGNGGAFGGKADSAAPAAARMLADVHGRAVRVLYTREDVVRIGPKRPPVALGLRADGTGLLRVVSTPGVRAAVAAVAPGLVVEEVPVPGPATSAAIRGAGWMEAAVALAALRAGVAGPRPGRATADVVAPGGGSAVAEVSLDAGGRPLAVHVRVSCGEILDPVVARSYAVGAAHMGLSWVLSEGLAVDADGIPTDLTVRSWGVLRARDTPPVTVVLEDGEGPAVNGSDAVMAAVAAATWIADGLGSRWPTRRGAFA